MTPLQATCTPREEPPLTTVLSMLVGALSVVKVVPYGDSVRSMRGSVVETQLPLL